MNGADLVCPRCGVSAVFRPVRGSQQARWTCPFHPDVYVGCHDGSYEPLGTLADRRTRLARQRCHIHFDLLWRGRSKRFRRACYLALATVLNRPVEQAHIGMLSIDECREVVNAIDRISSLASRLDFEKEQAR